jgi:hypothetical protein
MFICALAGFQWADYTVKPDSEYKYTVYAMTGEPVALTRSKSFDVKIKTEGGSDAIHTIYFNRGTQLEMRRSIAQYANR